MQAKPQLVKEGAAARGGPVTLWLTTKEPGPHWTCVCCVHPWTPLVHSQNELLTEGWLRVVVNVIVGML